MEHIARGAIIILCSLWFTHASAKSPPPTKGPADLYVLSISVGRYADKDFPKFDAGRYSAELVARSLVNAGARHAIILTDKTGQDAYITRDDVFEALSSLKRKIRKDRPRAPRILVYLLMHGVADATSNYLFMVPGNLVIEPKPVPQEDVFRLAKATVWNFDLLTSLMAFRMDERLNHFDDFVYSSLLPRQGGLAGLAEHSKNYLRYSNELDRRSRSYGPEPFDNAPIPFVLLMDNCTDGFRYNLMQPNAILDMLIAQSYDATLDLGRAYYATKPGTTVSTRILPEELENDGDVVVNSRGQRGLPVVGPLAIHLRKVLQERNNSEPLSLADFDEHFVSSYPDVPTPYKVEAWLRPDVARVDFLPRVGKPEGKSEKLPITSAPIRHCCEDAR